MEDQDLLKYRMNNDMRGFAVIFAYKNFSEKQKFAERLETNLDCSQLEMRLKNSGFKVMKYINKTKDATLHHMDTSEYEYIIYQPQPSLGVRLGDPLTRTRS